MKQSFMKKSSVVWLVLILVGLMVGCGSSGSTKMEDTTPPWLNDLPPEDVLWGIGSGRQGSGDQMSMRTAENRARTAIARQINSMIQNMFTDYNRDAGTTGNQANLSLQEDVTRELTQANVSGATIIKKWKAPDGTWWYLAEYNKANARTNMANVFDSEAARYAEFKADEALRMMDAQLAKNEKPLQVATD